MYPLNIIYHTKILHKNLYPSVVPQMYLAPENSPWGRDASSFYNVLVSQIYKYNNVKYFIICGDLNSRFGKENDYTPDIDFLQDRKILDFSKINMGIAY